MEQNYVLGFCFSPDMGGVVLIEKNKPEWQKGHLNGVGGKIEENELPKEAMHREFLEETGVVISADDWTFVGSLIGDDFTVYLFKVESEKYAECKTMETEEVRVYSSYSIHEYKIISNLHWIIPALIVRDFKTIQANY